MMDQPISPYGGQLVNLIADPARAETLRREALGLPSLELDWQQICELELLMSGAYSPLDAYMTRVQCDQVTQRQTLDHGTYWPVPVMLTSKQPTVAQAGESIALRDGKGFMLAMLTVSEQWQDAAGHTCYGGKVEGVAMPAHADFAALRLTPAALRAQFAKRGWHKVVAWQARQPIHRAQFEFCLKSAIENQSNLLLHPLAGGDLVESPAYFGLIRSFLAVRNRFPAASTQLALLPSLQRPITPQDLMLRAIIARNYGCTALIAGGEAEVEGERRRGEDLVQASPSSAYNQAEKIGVQLVAYPRMVYVEDSAEHMPESDVPSGARVLTLTSEEFHRRMQAGLKIPDWYSFPEVIAELQRNSPPRSQQGITIFFTGLSGAGKSTLARALSARLMEIGGRTVTLLDGDIVRRHLSSELGFNKAHRDINVRRIGFVASEITKHRGIAICAPIAPYRQTRRDVRAMVEAVGGFVEVHVATPIETCESRDRKGLYAKARAGLIPEFTGVSDPYEVPEHPELAIDTTHLGIEEAVEQILQKLELDGYFRE
ncbi:MAG: adenylyl-sulfate kinase [Thiobacillus sp.]